MIILKQPADHYFSRMLTDFVIVYNWILLDSTYRVFSQDCYCSGQISLLGVHKNLWKKHISKMHRFREKCKIQKCNATFDALKIILETWTSIVTLWYYGYMSRCLKLALCTYWNILASVAEWLNHFFLTETGLRIFQDTTMMDCIYLPIPRCVQAFLDIRGCHFEHFLM